MIKCVSLTQEINNNSSLKPSGSATHMADLPGPTIGAPTNDVNGSRESFEKRSPCWRMYRTPAAQLFLGRVMRLRYRRTGMSQLRWPNAIHPPKPIRKILDCLGLSSRVPLHSLCLQALTDLLRDQQALFGTYDVSVQA
jgi:hypothetical protein